ncbi:E3 ubiquitin-protein ligase TRIM47-like [Alosa sapidissima]|uniref:E3 ubiquitin-protein ligase TRIM47-like n=1 Tax=Alosa sapidissima TaxID=34773 RepID=UPI001C0A471F|nr:E3 ubiquitin-protein ligase TRIM47-like [Alosa sapidissima]
MMSDQSLPEPLHFSSGLVPSELDVSAGWVLCDACTDTAVKTCLTCMAFYCGSHVKDHYTSPDLERHQLQDLPHQDRCEQHNKKLKLYCRTDKSAICFRCLLHNHKGHDVIEQNPQGTQSKSLIGHGAPPPGQIEFTSVKPDSVTVSWSPPEGAPGPHRYRVTRRRGQEQRSITVAGLSLKVTDLIPGETSLHCGHPQ